MNTVELTEFFDKLTLDLWQPITFIPYGLLWGTAFLPVIFLLQRITARGRKVDWRQIVIWFCCVVYVYVALNMAFFTRESGSRTKIDLHLLGTWKEELSRNRFMVENIIMFLPFGILFPCVIPFLRKGRWCILVGCLSSTAIEAVQLITGRGYCQLDDVVANTVGAFLGWTIFKVGIICYKKT